MICPAVLACLLASLAPEPASSCAYRFAETAQSNDSREHALRVMHALRSAVQSPEQHTLERLRSLLEAAMQVLEDCIQSGGWSPEAVRALERDIELLSELLERLGSL